MVDGDNNMKKIYLAGPMTGKKYFNFPSFDMASNVLQNKGWMVFSPADNDRGLLNKELGWMPKLTDTADGTWTAWSPKFKLSLNVMLGQDLAWICNEADAIAMLPGWERSRGAMAEHATAVALGLEILYL